MAGGTPEFRAEVCTVCCFMSLVGVREGWFGGSMTALGSIRACPVEVVVTDSKGERCG